MHLFLLNYWVSQRYLKKLLNTLRCKNFSDASTKQGYKRSLLKCETNKTDRHDSEQPTFARGGIVSGIEKVNVIPQFAAGFMAFEATEENCGESIGA